MKTDISTLAQVKTLVDTFYSRVQQDDLLGDIFNSRIKDWPAHLAKMYRFWQTVLLDEHTYSGSPFLAHAELPVNAEHFNRWVAIWQETVDLYFAGQKASEAKWRGDTMAKLFLAKIEFYQSNDRKPLC